ncbi:I12R [African swine fever virus]|nr:I12R [African swine fever virus]
MFVQQVMQLFVSQVISVLYAYNKIHYLQQTIKPPSKKLGYRVPI